MIMMMLLADPPSRRVRHLLWNPYRLRRIINKKRDRQLSFQDVYSALLSTRNLVQNITPEWLGDEESRRHERKAEWVGQNYQKMVEEMANVVNEVPRLESNFSRTIRDFYTDNHPRAVANILNVEIVDLYKRPNKDPQYVVEVSIVPNTKGMFIGRGGAYMKEIQNRLNVRINFEE
jgi:transcription termination factor NusB